MCCSQQERLETTNVHGDMGNNPCVEGTGETHPAKDRTMIGKGQGHAKGVLEMLLKNTKGTSMHKVAGKVKRGKGRGKRETGKGVRGSNQCLDGCGCDTAAREVACERDHTGTKEGP